MNEQENVSGEKISQQEIDSELKKLDNDNGRTVKSHGEILNEQIHEGVETYKKNPKGTFLSSLTAGLEIGFSYLLLCTVYSTFIAHFSESTVFKLMALVYPVGFILVILGKSVLFTEQTSLLTLPVLNRKQSIASLLKIWGLVISGNLLGGFIISGILIWIGPHLDIFDYTAITNIAKHNSHYDGIVILVSGVLAGWVMGLLSWLLTSAGDTISRIFIIFLITTILAFTGLHHSIIGNIEVFSGMLVSAEITLDDYLKFESLALLGNAIGGVVFVALFKYGAFINSIKGY
jgi:formate-nitrite transporter family protein